MQNYNNTNSQSFQNNRLCESGNDKSMRSKRKHSQLYNYDQQQNFPLLKKLKNSLNNFPNHIPNNNINSSNDENMNFFNESRQAPNPFTKESHNKIIKENSVGLKSKINFLFCICILIICL